MVTIRKQRLKSTATHSWTKSEYKYKSTWFWIYAFKYAISDAHLLSNSGPIVNAEQKGWKGKIKNGCLALGEWDTEKMWETYNWWKTAWVLHVKGTHSQVSGWLQMCRRQWSNHTCPPTSLSLAGCALLFISVSIQANTGVPNLFSLILIL